jgi:hypothetical protein
VTLALARPPVGITSYPAREVVGSVAWGTTAGVCWAGGGGALAPDASLTAPTDSAASVTSAAATDR